MGNYLSNFILLLGVSMIFVSCNHGNTRSNDKSATEAAINDTVRLTNTDGEVVTAESDLDISASDTLQNSYVSGLDIDLPTNHNVIQAESKYDENKNTTLSSGNKQSSNTLNALNITSKLSHTGSVATNACPNDNKGNPCAKIIVEIPLEDVEFDGMYLLQNTVKRTAGQYEMFVSIPKTEGKTLTFMHKQYSDIEIPLWCDGSPLVGKQAYTIKISLPEIMSHYEEYVGVKKMEFVDILNSIIDESSKNNGHLTYDFMIKRGFEKLWDSSQNEYCFDDIPLYFEGECVSEWSATTRINGCGIEFVNEKTDGENSYTLGEEFTHLPKYSGSGDFAFNYYDSYKYKNLYVVTTQICGASNCFQSITVAINKTSFLQIIKELKDESCFE